MDIFKTPNRKAISSMQNCPATILWFHLFPFVLSHVLCPKSQRFFCLRSQYWGKRCWCSRVSVSWTLFCLFHVWRIFCLNETFHEIQFYRGLESCNSFAFFAPKVAYIDSIFCKPNQYFTFNLITFSVWCSFCWVFWWHFYSILVTLKWILFLVRRAIHWH